MSATLTCLRCGGDLGPGDRFCAQCGTAWAPCTVCSRPLLESDRVCPDCGATAAPILLPDPVPVAPSPWDEMVERLRRATAGEFEIGPELGRGGMAAVFLAHDLALDRQVAIKVMSPAVLLGDGMTERFRQEAVTIARLHHPHIVPVYAVRHGEGLHYFVMRYVRGRSLDQVIQRAGRLPLPIVRSILWQVAAGLTYAHRAGVVHRDIKPANILIDEDGDAIVTDFGIAKAAERPSQTQSGALVGTPAYMSPEQCRGGEVSWASDQYALGAVAYEMITGIAALRGLDLHRDAGAGGARPSAARGAPRRVRCRPRGRDPPDAGQGPLRAVRQDGGRHGRAGRRAAGRRRSAARRAEPAGRAGRLGRRPGSARRVHRPKPRLGTMEHAGPAGRRDLHPPRPRGTRGRRQLHAGRSDPGPAGHPPPAQVGRLDLRQLRGAAGGSGRHDGHRGGTRDRHAQRQQQGRLRQAPGRGLAPAGRRDRDRAGGRAAPGGRRDPSRGHRAGQARLAGHAADHLALGRSVGRRGDAPRLHRRERAGHGAPHLLPRRHRSEHRAAGAAAQGGGGGPRRGPRDGRGGGHLPAHRYRARPP